MIAQAIWQEKTFDGYAVQDPDDLYNAKALILWGGEDIATSLYNEQSVYSFSKWGLSRRDSIERDLVWRAVDLGIPILGVCRGAQLLCALDGGKLWQHVDNHAGQDHNVTLASGETIRTNSLHHQMMRPLAHNEVLGWSSDVLSPVKLSELGQHLSKDPEPEIVYFPKMKALGVQGHPEYTGKTAEGLRKFTKQLFNDLFKVQL